METSPVQLLANQALTCWMGSSPCCRYMRSFQPPRWGEVQAEYTVAAAALGLPPTQPHHCTRCALRHPMPFSSNFIRRNLHHHFPPELKLKYNFLFVAFNQNCRNPCTHGRQPKPELNPFFTSHSTALLSMLIPPPQPHMPNLKGFQGVRCVLISQSSLAYIMHETDMLRAWRCHVVWSSEISHLYEYGKVPLCLLSIDPDVDPSLCAFISDDLIMKKTNKRRKGMKPL